MEFPHLGKQCSMTTCNKLDFLSFMCDACKEIFCVEHYVYSKHNCRSSYKKDVQVPICPLCNTLVPVPRDQLPDIVVGAHIDNDCQSDPAKTRRKAYINKCSKKGCKVKEVVPVLCSECSFNFCLKHRHPTDHSCEGKLGASRRRAIEAAHTRQKNTSSISVQRNSNITTSVSAIQGSMSEDEALARALALSMEVSANGEINEESYDLELAQAIQQSENQRFAATTANRTKDKCILS